MMNMQPQGRVASEAACPNTGIDVSKEHLGVHLLDLGWRVDNDASGWDVLIAKLKEGAVDLVVVEATGGLRARFGHCAAPGAGQRGTRQPSPGARVRQVDGRAGKDRSRRRSLSTRLRRRSLAAQGPAQVHHAAGRP